MIYFRYFGGMILFSSLILSIYFGVWTVCAFIDQCAARNGMLP